MLFVHIINSFKNFTTQLLKILNAVYTLCINHVIQIQQSP